MSLDISILCTLVGDVMDQTYNNEDHQGNYYGITLSKVHRLTYLNDSTSEFWLHRTIHIP